VAQEIVSEFREQLEQGESAANTLIHSSGPSLTTSDRGFENWRNNMIPFILNVLVENIKYWLALL